MPLNSLRNRDRYGAKRKRDDLDAWMTHMEWATTSIAEHKSQKHFGLIPHDLPAPFRNDAQLQPSSQLYPPSPQHSSEPPYGTESFPYPHLHRAVAYPPAPLSSPPHQPALHLTAPSMGLYPHAPFYPPPPSFFPPYAQTFHLTPPTMENSLYAPFWFTPQGPAQYQSFPRIPDAPRLVSCGGYSVGPASPAAPQEKMRCLILRGDRRFWISDKDCGPDPGEKWVVFRDNPREYIRKLRAIWDDSSQYWESDQCHFRIRGEPIPAKYWNVAVKPWSSRIRERWSMWKTLMQELRTFSSVEDFMDSFKQGEQQKNPGVAQMRDIVRDRDPRSKRNRRRVADSLRKV